MKPFALETLRRRFEETAGPFPQGNRAEPPPHRVISESDCGDYFRREIVYEVEPGGEVPAHLLLPKGRGPFPCALALHPTIDCGKDDVVGLSGRPNRNYGEELALLGYAVLAPDYPYYGGLASMRKPWNWSVLGPLCPYFGETRPSPYDLGFSSATMLGIWNHVRGVDLLVSQAGVDPEKCAAIGHSLGGHNALFASLFEDRIGAVVTSCGFTRLPRYERGDVRKFGQDCYLPCVVSRFGGRAECLPWDFDELLAALAPRGLFVSAPVHDDNFNLEGVRECLTTATSFYQTCRHPDHLASVFPDCGHDFPPEARNAAYCFLGRVFSLPDANAAFIPNQHQPKP